MIFGLFAFFVGICITLVLIGIFLRKYGGIGLIGFGILFILSFIVLSGNLEVETGSNSTTYYTYNANGEIISNTQSMEYQYVEWNNITSHQVGFWLAIFSAFGFFGLLYAINKGGNNEEE